MRKSCHPAEIPSKNCGFQNWRNSEFWNRVPGFNNLGESLEIVPVFGDNFKISQIFISNKKPRIIWKVLMKVSTTLREMVPKIGDH